VPQNPYAQFNFLIEIEGITQGAFLEGTGFGNTQQVIKYREGIDPPRMRNIPGLVEFSNLVLRKGIISHELLEWRMTTVNGATERRSGSIVLRNEAGEEVLRWNFFEAWVCKWDGPALNATTNEIATESIEICYEYIETA
jgi:phage tail-like protein